MGRTRKTGASKGTKGQQFSSLFKKFLKQKKEMDRNLLTLEKKMFRCFREGTGTYRKKYVKRMPNKYTLKEAIRLCMKPDKEMTTEEVLKILHIRNLYRTRSKKLYGMVNFKLNNGEPEITKPKEKRGIFVYKSKVRSKIANSVNKDVSSTEITKQTNPTSLVAPCVGA